MARSAKTPPCVPRAIRSMLADYGLTARDVMDKTGRTQSTVWSWLEKGTQDLETWFMLEKIVGAPHGEILRRCRRRNGEPYLEGLIEADDDEAVEKFFMTNTRLLPHMREMVLRSYRDALEMSDEARGDKSARRRKAS